MTLRFSQRVGLTPVKKEIQISLMDADLRNGLWDVFKGQILDRQSKNVDRIFIRMSPFETLCETLWHHFYKLPIDKIPQNAEAHIRALFFEYKWYEVYDLVEFALTLPSFASFKIAVEEYKASCNRILEREFSGYRFIGDHISPITNEHEAKEIQHALDQSQNFAALHSCNIHLNAALAHLSNKRNPDYRNSIKESISAIESLAKTISGGSKDTLGAALDKIKGKIKLHQALEKGFKQIYGYTSDSSGIRHSLSEAPDCDFEDAMFMLVSSSAFINYLIVKCEKVGITFQAATS